MEGLEVVLVNPNRDKMIHNVGIHYEETDSNTEHVFAHGHYTMLYDNKKKIKPEDFGKMITKQSDKWKTNNGKNMVVIFILVEQVELSKEKGKKYLTP